MATREQQYFPVEFKPLAEGAILADFGNRIDPDLNRRAMALCSWLEEHPFPGLIETVPAYSSVAVFYDPDHPALSAHHDDGPITAHLRNGLSSSLPDHTGRLITIPVVYDGPDLSVVAELNGLDEDAVIRIHTSVTYDAYMIGFLPGFAYLGQVDPRIATPRRASPRTLVPAGSVGIAGRQTGIYPLDSPGGWQLIGRTSLRIFDSAREQPCLILPGDRIKFQSIGSEEFTALHGH
ncbi:MAG: 5-oxoprolinase subunit PxpB [Bacteroidota bacterium]